MVMPMSAAARPANSETSMIWKVQNRSAGW